MSALGNVPVCPSMVFWHDDYQGGQRIAYLARQTAKYTYLVMLDEARGVRLFKTPSKGLRTRPAGHNGKPYPLPKARGHYRRLGEQWGISKAAKEALKHG